MGKLAPKYQRFHIPDAAEHSFQLVHLCPPKLHLSALDQRCWVGCRLAGGGWPRSFWKTEPNLARPGFILGRWPCHQPTQPQDPGRPKPRPGGPNGGRYPRPHLCPAASEGSAGQQPESHPLRHTSAPRGCRSTQG